MTQEQYDQIRRLRKRVLFWGYFQSANAILAAAIAFFIVYDPNRNVANIGISFEMILILFATLFLLPGFILAFHIFLLKQSCSENKGFWETCEALDSAIKSIAPGWGIIFALAEAHIAQQKINAVNHRK